MLGARLSEPALYVDNPNEVAELRSRFEAAESRVAHLYSRWAELDQKHSGS